MKNKIGKKSCTIVDTAANWIAWFMSGSSSVHGITSHRGSVCHPIRPYYTSLRAT